MAKGTIIAGLSLAACLYGSVKNIQAHQKVVEELEQNADYRQSQRWENLAEQVDSAEHCLDYRSAWIQPIRVGKVTTFIHHPARYPDPLAAKGIINSIQPVLEQYAKQDFVQSLQHLGDRLPDQDNLRTYQGKSVDDSTFAQERTELKLMAKSLEQRAETALQRVPRELRDRKFSAGGWSVAFVLGTMFSVVAGLYTLARRRWEDG